MSENIELGSITTYWILYMPIYPWMDIHIQIHIKRYILCALQHTFLTLPFSWRCRCVNVFECLPNLLVLIPALINPNQVTHPFKSCNYFPATSNKAYFYCFGKKTKPLRTPKQEKPPSYQDSTKESKSTFVCRLLWFYLHMGKMRLK